MEKKLCYFLCKCGCICYYICIVGLFVVVLFFNICFILIFGCILFFIFLDIYNFVSVEVYEKIIILFCNMIKILNILN